MTAILLALVTFAATAPATAPAVGHWSRLPPLPDKEGFAGPFAGVSGGALLVAGGANFPDKKPWEGGRKVWYDTVFVLERPGGAWRVAGRLPRPLGYGVSVTHGDTVVCVGGSDADRHHADAFTLAWRDGRLVTTPLPALPRPVANACGAVVGDVLYVAGGLAAPDADRTLRTFYCLNLAAPDRWREADPCPTSGRMLAVAAATVDGSFWLAGGADLVAGEGGKVERRYLKDVYRYHPDEGWERVADLPRPAVAAPSPAPSDAAGFYLLGGDDGSQVGVAPDRHTGFGRAILRYDPDAGPWAEAGRMPVGRVTVPAVRWNDLWVIPSGEDRPGIRSPEVWGWSPPPPARPAKRKE